MKIAVLHPGAMGASVARALRQRGKEVFWVGEGRSDATRNRARGLDELFDLAALTEVDAVISVCPPDAALDLANAVVDAGFRGLYVDANAIAPDTARAVADLVVRAGGTFVDGGIIGPPASKVGTTRLYLSGKQAEDVAGWFDGTLVEAIPIGSPVGAASALKMCYAAYTKGTSALVLAVRALAEAEGVSDSLIGEWNRSQRGLAERSEFMAASSGPKAWRFAGEMQEIAESFDAAGLPDGFHHAAAEVYRKLAGFKDQSKVGLDDVLAALLE